jgi:hypothetical protein
LLALATLSAAGCAPVRVARECQNLAEIVKAGLRELEQTTRPDTPGAYRAAGPLYRKIAGQLRQTVASIELRPVAEDYARSVEAFGPNVLAYAEALESGEASRIEIARGELDRVSRREQMASRRIEIECRTRF